MRDRHQPRGLEHDTSATQWGVWISGGACNNVIEDSWIANNRYGGVDISGNGTDSNTITNDTIFLNDDGVEFGAGTSGNSVTDCTIDSNFGWGILDVSGDNSYTNNDIYSNTAGNIDTE